MNQYRGKWSEVVLPSASEAEYVAARVAIELAKSRTDDHADPPARLPTAAEQQQALKRGRHDGPRKGGA